MTKDTFLMNITLDLQYQSLPDDDEKEEAKLISPDVPLKRMYKSTWVQWAAS